MAAKRKPTRRKKGSRTIKQQGGASDVSLYRPGSEGVPNPETGEYEGGTPAQTYTSIGVKIGYQQSDRNELTAEHRATLSPKPTTEFLEKVTKLQLSVSSQGVATRRCMDVETLAILGLDALQEKYGQVDIDEHGRPIFDECGDFAVKHEGSITELVFRRPFGPPIRLKFDPGRGLIQEKEAA